MVNYRRNKIKGGTYFFTVVLRNRKSKILVDHIDMLREAMRFVKKQCPHEIKAIVILPDHIHAIWQLPQRDDGYAIRWQKIKALFTQRVIKKGVELCKGRKGEYNLWQPRYWEHTIRDDVDLEKHIDYIHYNPVKHGYVSSVSDWPYSSFHKYVRKGLLKADWAGDVSDAKGDFGE